MFTPKDFYELPKKIRESEEPFYLLEMRYNRLKHREIAHIAGQLYREGCMFLDGAYDAGEDRILFRLSMQDEDESWQSFPDTGTESYAYLDETEAKEALRMSGNMAFEAFTRADWIRFLTEEAKQDQIK